MALKVSKGKDEAFGIENRKTVAGPSPRLPERKARGKGLAKVHPTKTKIPRTIPPPLTAIIPLLRRRRNQLRMTATKLPAPARFRTRLAPAQLVAQVT